MLAKEIRARLGSLRSLKPGWDGRSAPAPSPKAIKSAGAFLEESGEIGRTQLDPDVNGGVIVTFKAELDPEMRAYIWFRNVGPAVAVLPDDGTSSQVVRELVVEPEDWPKVVAKLKKRPASKRRPTRERETFS